MDDAVFASRPDLARTGEQPVHARIGVWLEELIRARQLQPGQRLPPELDMSAALGVNRMTLRQALAGLVTQGLIEPRRGRFGGNFVSEPRVDFNLAGLPGFTEQMRRAQVKSGAHVTHATTTTPPPEVRAALMLKRGQKVHKIYRVRSADGEPIALEETFLPAGLFPGLLERDLTSSLYEIMGRDFAMAPDSAEESIEPALATADQAEGLQVEVGALLLRVSRTTYAVDRRPIEFARDYFRPDRTRVLMRTRVEQDRA